MASRETQSKIIAAAIRLFNEDGTERVSGARIAEACGISKGNLHYHFPTREALILAIWGQIEAEIRDQWGNDAQQPTLVHMAELTQRQFRLIWRYRFLYRELGPLLERDAELCYRFRRLRMERMGAIHAFFEALTDSGVLRPQHAPQALERLIKIAWIVTDYWISYIIADERDIDMTSMQEGYELMLQLFDPFFTDKARSEIPDSFRAFRPDA